MSTSERMGLVRDIGHDAVLKCHDETRQSPDLFRSVADIDHWCPGTVAERFQKLQHLFAKRRIKGGWAISAQPMATRCRSPPD